MSRCQSCGSSAPHRHPAVQEGGEVQICVDDFHLQPTPQNGPGEIRVVHVERHRRETVKKAELYDHMKQVAEANGFESLTQAIAEASKARETVAWRCFHCEEVFTDARHARDHFGHDEGCKPACQIKAGGERGLIEALRAAERDASDAWFALQNDSSTTAKAFRAMQGRHLQQITAAEQAGYERGLRDAQAHPETLGLVAATGSPPWQQEASQ